jgi:hypothetical protein
MKKIYAYLSLFLSVLAISFTLANPSANAQSVSASYATINFTGPNLTASPQQLFAPAAILKAIKGISIFNGSTGTIILALGPNSSTTTDMLVIPPGGSTTVGPSLPVYFPLVASQNQGIYIHTSTGSLSTGFLQATVFYN